MPFISGLFNPVMNDLKRELQDMAFHVWKKTPPI